MYTLFWGKREWTRHCHWLFLAAVPSRREEAQNKYAFRIKCGFADQLLCVSRFSFLSCVLSFLASTAATTILCNTVVLLWAERVFLSLFGGVTAVTDESVRVRIWFLYGFSVNFEMEFLFFGSFFFLALLSTCTRYGLVSMVGSPRLKIEPRLKLFDIYPTKSFIYFLLWRLY